MTWAGVGHFLRDIAPIVAMFTSLFLLWQGQRDRRRLAEERRREQVDQLVLSDAMHAIDDVPANSLAREVYGSSITDLTVRNESKTALQVRHVAEVHPGRSTLFSPGQLVPGTWPILLAPGVERRVTLSPGWASATTSANQPYVVVLVRDAYGRTWRKRSDTAASKRALIGQAPPLRARMALRLEHHWLGRPLWWAVYRPLDRRLSRLRDTDSDHTPWTLRISHLAWGRWDADTNDPWLYPGTVLWQDKRDTHPRNPVPGSGSRPAVSE